MQMMVMNQVDVSVTAAKSVPVSATDMMGIITGRMGLSE